MWIVRAIQHWKLTRAARMALEERDWDFEPSTLQIRLRQAYCILVAHKWVEGMMSDPYADEDDPDEEGCVLLVSECLRCGINRFDDCLVHAPTPVE